MVGDYIHSHVNSKWSSNRRLFGKRFRHRSKFLRYSSLAHNKHSGTSNVQMIVKVIYIYIYIYLSVCVYVSGTIFGMANTLSSFGGFLSSFIVGKLTNDNVSIQKYIYIYIQTPVFTYFSHHTIRHRNCVYNQTHV